MLTKMTSLQLQNKKQTLMQFKTICGNDMTNQFSNKIAFSLSENFHQRLGCATSLEFSVIFPKVI